MLCLPTKLSLFTKRILTFVIKIDFLSNASEVLLVINQLVRILLFHLTGPWLSVVWNIENLSLSFK